MVELITLYDASQLGLSFHECYLFSTQSTPILLGEFAQNCRRERKVQELVNNKEMWNEILIEGDEYDECVRHSGEMWSNTKEGSNWNRGLINTTEDPHRAERVGNLGEMAFGKTIGQKPDFTYHEGGDKQDFLVEGKSVNVKNAQQYKGYGGLVRATSTSGKTILPLNNDVYAFTYLIEENRQERKARVMVVGWQTAKEIESLPMVSARSRSSHKNYEVLYEKMRPMETLLAAVKGNL